MGYNTVRSKMFQSTPPVAGERCLIIFVSSLIVLSFQSTPPVAGERCPINDAQRDAAILFQSTPPVAGERCKKKEAEAPLLSAVSIHAPRCRGAMPKLWALPGMPLKFQSTPPVAGERCHSHDAFAFGKKSFNPRPPLPGSDANADKAPYGAMVVSIHAPRCRGAMHVRRLSSWYQLPKVSIHAPRCRGAMRPTTYPPFNHIFVSIHAPRCRGAMHRKTSGSARFDPFQSTPPVAGERCAEQSTFFKPPRQRFNPRPPLPGSDATSCAHTPAAELFQSTPPVAGERCPRFCSSMTQTQGFQSTPPVAGERCKKLIG